MQNTPSTTRIINTLVLNPRKIRFPTYESSSDPSQDMTSFCIAMGRAQFTAKERDIAYCQLFVENLSGVVLTWFSSFEANSIGIYHQLSTAFFKHYSMYIQRDALNADLLAMTQGPKKSLRSYIKRFKAALPAL